VLVAVGQRQQDLERHGGERQERLGADAVHADLYALRV
jgi:hypothetical protein